MDAVLPGLLERAWKDRGWRVLVRSGSPERAAALDGHLWTYSDESFLPHGQAGDPFAARQPILLSAGAGNPNAAQALFLVDGADAAWADEAAQFARVVVLFDGGDDAARTAARAQWLAAKAAGHEVTYWQQSPAGRWEKKA